MSALTLKLPHIVWRDGRPRFSPGASVRKLGFGGKDLRHDDGRWFTAAEASAWANHCQQKIVAARQRGPGGTIVRAAKRPALRERTFIYFIRCGNAIKIGFSDRPIRRTHELSTGAPEPIVSIAAVLGTRTDERRLHRALAAYRRHGEWFEACAAVVTVMTHTLARGAVTLDPLFDQTANKPSHAAAYVDPKERFENADNTLVL
jgi:T5orf172 domain